MNIKLLVGIALFVIGLALAVVGIVNVGDGPAEETAMVVGNNQSQDLPTTAGTMMVPALAALSLGVGGLLIALSFGNWKNPRTHQEPGDEAVNPEGHHKMKHV